MHQSILDHVLAGNAGRMAVEDMSNQPPVRLIPTAPRAFDPAGGPDLMEA